VAAGIEVERHCVPRRALDIRWTEGEAVLADIDVDIFRANRQSERENASEGDELHCSVIYMEIGLRANEYDPEGII
jgi:hypothetical protein